MIVAGPVDVHGRRRVALTFDDGPSQWTFAIADTLAAAGAHATFFVLGNRVAGHEQVLQRLVRDGHQLANHTFGHPRCSTVARHELVRELREGSRAIAEATGVVPTMVRPPYGDGPEAVDDAAREIGLATTVLWSVDPEDWAEPPAATIVDRVLAGAQPGSIVLLHDGFPPHEGPHHTTRAETADAVAQIVPALVEDGFELVTVDALLRA